MLDKTFDPAAIEETLYAGWEGSGAFERWCERARCISGTRSIRRCRTS